MKSLFEPHLNLCAKVMDLRLSRQNLVVGNLTNVNTPGYKPRRLDFEEKLQKALDKDANGKMARTEQGHLPAVFEAGSFAGDFEKEFKPRVEHGQDSVDMDQEMAILQKNTLAYDTLSTLVRENFKGLARTIADLDGAAAVGVDHLAEAVNYRTMDRRS